jgi:hypothetical protein
MGAATIALTGARAPRTGVKVASTGIGTFAIGTITPSSSYASGGDTLDFGTSFGLIGNRVDLRRPAEPTAVFVQPSAGYVAGVRRDEQEDQGVPPVRRDVGADRGDRRQPERRHLQLPHLLLGADDGEAHCGGPKEAPLVEFRLPRDPVITPSTT